MRSTATSDCPTQGLTSVVIPVHNGQAFIAEAIASAKKQTYRLREIIVVDDGSTDATADLVKRIDGVRYFFRPRGGPASALNFGADHARGSHIAFLSADDLWLPDKLELQHAALAARSPRTLVFGRMRAFAEDPDSRRRAMRQAAGTDPVDGIAAGTLLMTTTLFNQVGPFDERLLLGSFIEWYGRARLLGLETLVLPEVVAMRRIHDANFSTAMLRTHSYLPALKAHLDRVRNVASQR